MQIKILGCITSDIVTRSRSRILTISAMEVFAAKVNDWKPFTIVTKNSVVDIAGVWDPSMELDLGTQPPLGTLLSVYCGLCFLRLPGSSFPVP